MATPASPTGGKEPEWLVLQKRIFTRWLNQKLALRQVKIENCVTDLAGEVLVELLEVLSEKSFGKARLPKAPKLRVQKIDNANRALQFMKQVGVETELPTSAENLVDGHEKSVLGLVWAVMRKFMKFGNEDDPKLNARDALLQWVQNQVRNHKGANPVDFTKSWHNGLTFCALIHHFRPKLINYDKLNPANAIDNLNTAFKAAEEYFGLDQYLQAADIAKLDEKGMIVYVSEYYAGIAAQRKMDIAGRRITKLVKYTQSNDAMRAEYLEKGKKLKELLDKWCGVLQDRTIDNTMAGAKKRLDDFFEYKTKDKLPIIDFYLSVEALFSHLAMRLADHKRPPFNPPAGWTLPELSKMFLPLEKCEQERNVALHEEFYRQQNLVRLNDQHEKLYQKLKAWIAAKKTYLETKEAIASSGDAQFQLNGVLAYNEESAAVKGGTVKELTDLGAELAKEKYEHVAAVKQREDDIAAGFVNLGELAATKHAVLKDAVAREEYRERIELLNGQHVTSHGQFKAWLAGKEAYITGKETIASVRDAQVALGALSSYAREADSQKAAVGPFKALGNEVSTAKYDSKHSNWSFPDVAGVQAREQWLDAQWVAFDGHYANKLAVLKDDLAREEFREKVVLNNQQHGVAHAQIKAWVDEKAAFLAKKEDVKSVRDARFHLDILGVFKKAKSDMSAGAVTGFKALGKEILDAKYESKHSSYTFPTPAEVTEREQWVADAFAKLDEAAAAKLAVLQDDLAREEFREKVQLANEQHASSHATLKAWIDAKEAYLQKKEEVNSIQAARVALNVLGVFKKSKADLATDLAAFQKLGREVLDSKYNTNLSNWAYDKPEEVQARLAFVEGKWKELDELAAAKKAVLDADEARELKKEDSRLAFAATASRVQRWAKDTIPALANNNFGHSLAAVEAYSATLAKSDGELKTQAGAFQAEYTGAFKAGEALGVTENKYTTSTVAELDKALADVAAAQGTRQAAHGKELEKQRANDSLCKKLADVVLPFTKALQSNKDAVSASKEDLEGQLKQIQALIASAPSKEGAALPEIKKAQEAVDAAHVSHNPHTLLTARDCDVQWQQYQAFLARKQKQIEEEIQHKKLRGVTPEQYAEIEQQFKQFDKNGSGSLDKNEFKACLFSLGYEFDGAMITKLMNQFGNKDAKDPHILKAGFTEFMISTLGDTDTKDEIVAGFKLINKNQDFADPHLCGNVMADDVLKYLTGAAPAKGKGFDYTAVTNDMFAR